MSYEKDDVTLASNVSDEGDSQNESFVGAVPLGLHKGGEDEEKDEEKADAEAGKYWFRDNKWTLLRVFFAEFLGMAVFAFMARLCRLYSAVAPEGSVGLTAVGAGTGFAVGAMIAGKGSGGHLNPAITLALVIVGAVDWKSLIFYGAGQNSGALVGSGLASAALSPITDATATYKLNVTVGSIAFGSRPAYGFQKTPILIWKELVGSLALSLAYLTGHDESNNMTPSPMAAIYYGLALTALQLATADVSSTEFNPSLDFFSRLAYSMAGGEKEVWVPEFFILPVVLPFAGASLGAFAYTFTISKHWPAVLEAKRVNGLKDIGIWSQTGGKYFSSILVSSCPS